MVILQTISAGVEGWSDTGVLYGLKGKRGAFSLFSSREETKRVCQLEPVEVCGFSSLKLYLSDCVQSLLVYVIKAFYTLIPLTLSISRGGFLFRKMK